MPKKLSHDYVKSVFEGEGYTLLDQYESATKRMDFVCPNGHRHSIAWAQFQSGKRCAYCRGKIVRHEDVEKAFTSEGYKLVSAYKNSGTKVDFECPLGHRHSMSWDAFKSGIRCAYCRGQIVTQEMVEKVFVSRGYTLLSQYKNKKSKLRFICPKGHEHSISWDSFSQGRGCGVCARKLITQEEVEKTFSDRGYTLLDKYTKSTARLKFICPEGHHHSITWSEFRIGTGCARCAGQWKTDEEREITKIQDRLHQQLTYAVYSHSLRMQPKKHVLGKKIAQSLISSIGKPPNDHHIDHIVPQSFFDLRNEDEVFACWSICNLRYIPASENSRRGNNLTLEEASGFTTEQFEVLMMASRMPLSWKRWVEARKLELLNAPKFRTEQTSVNFPPLPIPAIQ